MTKSDKQQPAEIVVAAQALEEELQQLEAIARSVQKIHLNSEKALTRAATELKELLALPDRMTERLQAVVAAMTRMQERQQAALEPLAETAAQIQTRSNALQAHQETFAALGTAVAEVNALLIGADEKPAVLARAEKQLDEIATRARALSEAARVDDFPEVAREADVLKQRLAALSKRLRANKPN